jgi:hypothetical protein
MADQVRTRRGQAKENPAALLRAEWHDHVARTPCGFVPQIMLGTVFIYGIAMGTRWTAPALVEHVESCAPRRYWPAWMQRISTEQRR